MPVNKIIGVVIIFLIGVFCAKVLISGLRHGVIRPRWFYGPLSMRASSPGDYWSDVAFWAIYTALCFGLMLSGLLQQ